jgi:hypothetical protein
MEKYRNLEGECLCKAYKINKKTGSFKILNVRLEFDKSNYKATLIRFTIFDYITKTFTFNATYDKIENLKNYNAFRLAKLL